MRLIVGPPWLRVTVTADGDVAQRLEPFLESAGGETGAEGNGPTLKVVGAEKIPAATGGADFKLEGDVYGADGADGKGRYYLNEGRGEVTLTPRSGPFFETFLRQIFLLESYRRGGLVLHSVAFAEGDAVILSCGESGSGKSTLAATVRERFTVYSDEMNVVGRGGRVWALPFRGTGVERVKAGGGVLRILAFHRPGREFGASPIEPAAAVRELWSNVFFAEAADAEMRKRAFERVADLAQRARAYAVTVPREAKATRGGFSEMFNEAFSIKEGQDEP
jgi:hypothetical protein